MALKPREPRHPRGTRELRNDGCFRPSHRSEGHYLLYCAYRRDVSPLAGSILDTTTERSSQRGVASEQVRNAVAIRYVVPVHVIDDVGVGYSIMGGETM